VDTAAEPGAFQGYVKDDPGNGGFFSTLTKKPSAFLSIVFCLPGEFLHMESPVLSFVFLLLGAMLLLCGCTEPPLKEPTVTVQEIELADVSLRTLTVNTTFIIGNPNPVGAHLNKVAFDIWYVDDGEHYLGYGEQTDVDIRENGNTTVVIPVKIGTVPSVQAIGTLVSKGSAVIKVNGSASLDLKLTGYEIPFTQKREFLYEDFMAFLTVSSLEEATGVNVTNVLGQAKGILDAMS
jgi:LEA14-like dessication related protein